MMKEDFSINFSGFTHDHAILYNNNKHCDNIGDQQKENNNKLNHIDSSCSTIAILRRHPMYDSLILVKKYKNCLNGFSLEFPSDNEEYNPNENPSCQNDNNLTTTSCNRRRLVSRFLDGDDPMYQSCSINGIEMSVNDSPQNQTEPININSNLQNISSHPFAPQIDDKGNPCELIHVPINGLLDRLKNYTESGIAVDSRVYAFAMGLKTAERILATSSMKEPQETPI